MGGFVQTGNSGKGFSKESGSSNSNATFKFSYSDVWLIALIKMEIFFL